MNAILFILAGIVFLATGCLAENVDSLYDALDPRPSWYMGLFNEEVCSRICCGPLYSDHDMLDNVDGSLVWSRRIKAGGGPSDSCDVSNCGDIYLLAWLQRKSLSSTAYAGEIPYKEWIALVLARKQDKGSSEKWTLLTLSSDCHEADTSVHAFYWHLSWGYDYSLGNGFLTMRLFDSLPTNAEIYQSLEEWTSANGGFFNYDITTKKNVWKGFEFLFVDGDVREKTWEAVIGEKPTRFFPNGK